MGGIRFERGGGNSRGMFKSQSERITSKVQSLERVGRADHKKLRASTSGKLTQ